MSERRRFPAYLRGFLIVMGVVLMAVITVAMIGWWSGWTTLAEFERAIQLAGILVMGIGLVGFRGNLDLGRKAEERRSTPGSDMEGGKEFRQFLADLVSNYAFTLIMFLAGAICLLIGWLLY